MTPNTQDTQQLTPTVVRELVQAAVLAPSGDNLQPWNFEINSPGGQITIHVDEARDPSPMNAGQRMSRIAVGAALETVAHVAAYNGGKADISIDDDASAGTVALHGLPSVVNADPVVAARVTNRRRYDGLPLPTDVLNDLQASCTHVEGVRPVWMVEPDRIRVMASLVRRADTMLFSMSEMRCAFFDNVRFDCPPDQAVDWGLSLDSLEVTPAERPLFRMLPKLPDWLCRIARVANTIGAKSERLVRSSSGLCLFVAPDDRSVTDYHVGRAVQRTWLAMTAAGLAVQPMSSMFVLSNWLQFGPTNQHASARIEDILGSLQKIALIPASDRPAFLLRCGSAAAATGRTGRLSHSD